MLFLRYIIALSIIIMTLPASSLNLPAIKTAVENKYLELYPTLSISSLTLKPLGIMPRNFANYQLEKITLSAASLKRNTGTFSVLYSNTKKKKKRFFKFKLDATIGVYVSQRYIKKDRIIDDNYVTFQEVAFEKFRARPIDEHYFYNYESKRSIKKGKIITVNDLRRIIDIKRGDTLDATLVDEAVQLTFKVKAVEEGNIGDIIKVKRGHYKKFKAQITSKNTVDILE